MSDVTSPPSPEPAASPEYNGKPLNGWLFAAAMFIPPLLTLVAGELVVEATLIGGAVGGIVAGAMLGNRFGKTTLIRVLLGFLLAPILTVACISMCGIGCLLTGNSVAFH